MTPTPADPAEILAQAKFELTARRKTNLYLTRNTAEGLVAAVEALRVRVTELEGEIEQAIKWQQFYMNKAETAEARIAELAGALEVIAGLRQPIDNLISSSEIPRAFLTVTPDAETLERARAVEEVIQLAKDGLETGFGAKEQRLLDMALAKLEEGP